MACDVRWFIHDDSALWLREQPDVPRDLLGDPEDEFCPWDEEEVRYFRA
ncbi:hypothetical protein [Ornithinimicrobium sp. Y1694]